MQNQIVFSSCTLDIILFFTHVYAPACEYIQSGEILIDPTLNQKCPLHFPRQIENWIYQFIKLTNGKLAVCVTTTANRLSCRNYKNRL